MRARKRLIIAVAGGNWTIEEVILPKKIQIKRVRAISEDPGDIAISIREASTITTDLDIPLEYALVASPIDSEEDIYAEVKGQDPKRGIFYIAAKASVDTNISIQLEYET